VDLPTLTLLDTNGVLLFSTNRHGFKLDTEALKQNAPGLQIEDITRATLPRDFQRMPPAHKCWRIVLE
jgi:23S rRNA (guanine2445-N2)-methyltransferase / 23S rRNA (guanine2069-N7)-methyltransferase